MEAIITKYHAYPHELHGSKAHEAAARALLADIGIYPHQPLHVGEVPHGYIFLCAELCETLPAISFEARRSGSK